MRRQDLIAGLSVAGLMLPEAVAYAAIAGLPASRGVAAGVAGCLVYGLIGRSRFAILSPTSSSAAILAAMIVAGPGRLIDAGTLATAATLLAGAMFLAGALLGLGGLSALIPRPVLKGFAFGIALTIILKQLPVLLGIAPAPGAVWSELAGLAAEIGGTNPWSLASGAAALALYLLVRRWWPRAPAAFLTLLFGVGLSAALSLGDRGVALTGALDVHAALPALPDMSGDQWALLARYVVPLVLILLAESWGTVSALAASHGDSIESRRELAGFGLANLAAGLAQGMPVGAGFSAGSAAEVAGAATRLTAVFAALALLALVIVAGPVVARLPLPVLAAVVTGTLFHTLSPAPFRRLWRLGRDFWLAVAAALAVLLFGVLDGMLIAVALSVAGLIRRLMTPRVAILGRIGSARDYVDMARHPDARPPAGLIICRPAEPLFYGNAAGVLDRVAAILATESGVRELILSLEETFDLDSTTLDALTDFDRRLAGRNIGLRLARVHDHVRDVLGAADEHDLLARSSYSVDDAVTRALAGVAAKEATDVS